MKRKKKTTKRKKCSSCGKIREVSLTKTIVPTYFDYKNIPPYQKGKNKIKREDLKGDRKCIIKYFCEECR